LSFFYSPSEVKKNTALVFVGPQYTACCMLPFWSLELLRGGSQVLWGPEFDTPEEKRAMSLQSTCLQTALCNERTNGYKKRKRRAMSICGGSLPLLTKRTGKLVPHYRFYSFLESFDFRSSSGTGNKCLFCVDDFSSLVVLTMTWLFCGQNKTGHE